VNENLLAIVIAAIIVLLGSIFVVWGRWIRRVNAEWNERQRQRADRHG
jgi:uncharacterized protein (DUF2062 family)